MIAIPNSTLRRHTRMQNIEEVTPQQDDVAVRENLIAHTIITMPHGIIGFEHIHTYSLEHHTNDIIYKLVGEENASPVFYVINPYLINPEYTLSMRDEEYMLLGSPDFKHIIVFVILTLQQLFQDTTCNFLGPIVINNKNNIALQVINDSNDWGTKHLLVTGEKVPVSPVGEKLFIEDQQGDN